MKMLYGLPAGLIISAFVFTQMASAALTTLFVATNATGDGSGSSWANATNSIQGAISAIDNTNPTNTVWVSNGVYEADGITNFPSGTILTNRVAIYKPITVRSANNDPTNTIIKGVWNSSDQTNAMGPAAVRCVYMTNGSSLIGFTLSNGATLKTAVANETYGGGVYCQSTNTVISNCVIVANASYAAGGGTYYGTLYNCTLNTNVTGGAGGGSYYGTLYYCTLSNNWTTASIGYPGTHCGGGAYGGIMSNCTIVGNRSQIGWQGGGVYYGTFYNCTLSNNFSDYGSAADSCTLSNCTIVGNRGSEAARSCTLFDCRIISNSVGIRGGGASSCILSNCTLIANSSATDWGGGATYSILYNCTLTGNRGNKAGGAYLSTLYNCMITNNSSDENGGGAYNSTLYNCTIVGNLATKYGGGAFGGTQYNCTIANNSASIQGGGASSNNLNNCIVYFNNAPNGSNWYENDVTIVFTNSCTAPAPAAGSRNITGNPMFVDTNTANYRLSVNSPCINTGTNGSWTTNSYDRDGRTRIRYGTVDMGAYENIYDGSIYTIH